MTINKQTGQYSFHNVRFRVLNAQKVEPVLSQLNDLEGHDAVLCLESRLPHASRFNPMTAQLLDLSNIYR